MKSRSFKRLGVLLAGWLLATCAWAGTLTGEVVAIADGDTLTVLVERTQVRVRLAQIDAPERKQAFGTRARQALSERVFRRTVRVEEAGTDRYGRVIGTVWLGGRNINEELVRAGYAWAFTRYVSDARYFAWQDEARRARRGLWAEPDPVPPWQFRRPGS